MIKSKKQMFLVIICFTLVLILGTVSYAFFNYTRTGTSNNVRVGRISFVSRNEETITISDLFPIDPEEPGIMNDSTKVGTYEIEIQGDTDYSYGVEYLVSTQDVRIYTSEGNKIPISINITVNNLGTEEANYFTERNDHDTTIYKKLSGNAIVGEQQLLVGYIKPNTTEGTAEGVNGKITIKAYIDKNKISISNTYDGTESDDNGTTNVWVDDRVVVTEEEWNALHSTGVSFKIKVEANSGIWVDEPFYDVMQRNTVMDNINSTFVNNSSPGIDFAKISSDTNGKGIYTKAGTEDDAYPIMYYRGDVDNNVLFANYCWKIVRTTDTGGIKLIYNGEMSPILEALPESDYGIINNTGNISFDNNEKAYVLRSSTTMGSSNNVLEFSFHVPAGDDYILEISKDGDGSVNGTFYNGTSLVAPFIYAAGYAENQLIFGTMSNDDYVNIKYYISGTIQNEAVFKIKMLKPNENNEISCDNILYNSAMYLNENNEKVNAFKYNIDISSYAYSGYMYGNNLYTFNTGFPITGAYFSNDITYDSNSNTYSLVDPVPGYELNNSYTCNSSDPNGTCSEVRFYVGYNVNSNYSLYMALEDGKDMETALIEMQENINDSIAKDKIDTWYEQNILNTNYNNRMEDTVWCNDRSFATDRLKTHNSIVTYQKNRLSNGTPSLICKNKNDRFTVNSEVGNKKLDYPIGLLTADEIMLAGANNKEKNYAFYLYTGTSEWTMSWHSASSNVVLTGGILRSNSFDGVYEIRPAISLKQGTSVISGNGTPINPYIIK